MTNFGKKKIKSADWFEAHIETMVPAIEEILEIFKLSELQRKSAWLRLT